MKNERILGFVSGKGGVGKTTLCVNVGMALREMGKEVTLVDADFSAANLSTYLGEYDHPVNIQEVLDGVETVEEATFRHPSGVKAITAANEIDRTEPDTERFRKLLERATEHSDYVLVDSAPGVNQQVESIMDACDELVVVTEPTQTSGVNAAQIIEKAMELKKPVLGTVINKFEDHPEKELIENEVEIMTGSQVLKKVPHDDYVKESLFNNQPVVHHEPLSEAAIEIKKLAAGFEGKQYQAPKLAGLRRNLKELGQKLGR